VSELSAQFNGGAAPETVAVTAAEAVVLGPLDVQAYDRFTVYVQNVGGGSGDDVAAVTVETGPTSTGPWVDVVTVLAAPLASGSSNFKASADQSNKYIRIRANCAGGQDTTARFWLCVGAYNED
jgi:hypothetical protein